MSPRMPPDSQNISDAVSTQAGITLKSATNSWPAISDLGNGELSDVSLSSGPPPSSIGGRFRVEQLLGSGAFGAVYQCFDEQLHQQVAVKLAHGRPAQGIDGCDQIVHEARATARVTHRHIVGVKDVGKTVEGLPYVVFDLVHGRSLKELLVSGEYTMAEAVNWIADLAGALHVAHRNHLVHRDIKPANILINHERQALLSDFGLARVCDHFFMEDRGCVGTLAYMSPEQAAGRSHLATPQSDLYSLGVVLYELICQKRPFDGDNEKDLREQICHKAVVSPRALRDGIPVALERVCLRALAKEPEDRFATGEDFATALRTVLPRPRRLLVAGLVAAMVCLGALASAGVGYVLGWWGSPTIPPVPQLAIWTEGSQQQDRRSLSVGDAAWRAGDQVEITPRSTAPSYMYLYWFDATSDGRNSAERIFPDELDGHLMSTSAPTLRQTITGAPGWDLVLVVTAARQLTHEQDVHLRQVVKEILPELTRASEVSELTSLHRLEPADQLSISPADAGTKKIRPRGGKRVDSTKWFVAGLPGEAADLLLQYHATYHGWLVPRN